MLDSPYLLISHLILIVEQETPPLHFWQVADNSLEQFCPFFLKNNLLNALGCLTARQFRVSSIISENSLWR